MNATADGMGNGPAPLAVPATVFVDGPKPAFVLFDRLGRVADPAVSRLVYVFPSDVEACDGFLQQRVSVVARSRRITGDARAWMLHRVLHAEARRALAAVPAEPSALPPLTALLALIAEHLPPDPAPFLSEVARAEQDDVSHSVARAIYAATLGVAEGFDDRDGLTSLLLAGVFADIAKMRLPDSILSRPEALNEDEWEMVRQHPALAAELLQRVGIRTPTAIRAIRGHHERWAGDGYPDALQGHAIPLEARILAVADAYAALTEDRPYRAALRGYEALLVMAQGEGQFEPRLLRSFVRLLGRALSANARWSPAERSADPLEPLERAGAA